MLTNLAIITLNYNSYEDTVRQVQHLQSQGAPASVFFVSDNASNDFERMRQFCLDHHITFVPNRVNNGYAHGNNTVIREAYRQHKNTFLILNPDIEIDWDVIQAMYRRLCADPAIGVIGCRICDKDRRDLIFSDGGQIYPERGFRVRHFNNRCTCDTVDSPTQRVPDFVNGSVMMFHDRVLLEAGMMREDFFMYYEEAEWCYRITRKTDFRLRVCTDLTAYHTASRNGRTFHYCMSRNRLWLCRMYGKNATSAFLGTLRNALKSLWNRKGGPTCDLAKCRLYLSALRDAYRTKPNKDNYPSLSDAMPHLRIKNSF